MNKIIDAFAFYNEVDMLEYRLETLYDVVDKFIIVEATMTHSGLEKPLNFELNKERYKKYLDKIHYVVNTKLPRSGVMETAVTPWHANKRVDGLYYRTNYNVMREYTHIDSLKEPLLYLDIDDNDIVLFMAPDEVPCPRMLHTFRENGHHLINDGLILELTQYFYDHEHFQEIKGGDEKGVYGEDWRLDYWHLSHAISYGGLKKMFDNDYTIYDIRSMDWTRFRNSGWHLSWFEEDLADKMKSIVHPNFLLEEDMMRNIKERKPMSMEDPWNNIRLTKVKPQDNNFPIANWEFWERKFKEREKQ
tara:strand:- start:120 stop:1031 length:912 start_codon:yes stop_codon:yes gene_type:complete